MSLPAPLADALQQWNANPRLRFAVGIAGALVALYLVLVIADWRDGLRAEYQERSAYMQKLRGLAGQPEWLEHAQAAARLRKGLEAGIAKASTLGIAQAEVQGWARERAAGLGGQVQITSPAPAEVDGDPGLWRVPVTLAGTASPQQLVQLMHTVEKAPTLAVIEEVTLLNRENRTFSITVAFHYRVPGSGQ
jgi:hypothetical protein